MKLKVEQNNIKVEVIKQNIMEINTTIINNLIRIRSLRILNQNIN